MVDLWESMPPNPMVTGFALKEQIRNGGATIKQVEVGSVDSRNQRKADSEKIDQQTASANKVTKRKNEANANGAMKRLKEDAENGKQNASEDEEGELKDE